MTDQDHSDSPSPVDCFRRVLVESERRLPLADAAAVATAFPQTIGAPDAALAEKIRSAMSSEQSSDFDTHDLRRVAATFALEAAIDGSPPTYAKVLRTIAQCVSGGTMLKPLSDPSWTSAVDWARARVVLDAFVTPDHRSEAVGRSGRRLRARGYALRVGDGAYVFEEGELERATSDVTRLLRHFGSIAVHERLFSSLKRADCGFEGLYFPVRDYLCAPRDPSIP
jgi:hypothetical protein